MDPIKDISALAQNLKKLEKQNEPRKVDANKGKGKTEQSNTVKHGQDKAEISEAARNLLSAKTEAEKYLKLIENTKIIDDDEMQEIREKVLTNYYSDKTVIEKITEKLLNLPNYVMNTDEVENNNQDNNENPKHINS